MEYLQLGNLGQCQKSKVESIATCLEFGSLFAGETDKAKLARLCAGAIGIAVDKSARMPKYRPFRDEPMTYGRKCLEILLESGVYPSKIYESGTLILVEMLTAIPREEEIEEQANFTDSAKEAD